MKSFSICAGLAALAMSFVSAEAASAANTPGAHILVIDRRAIMTGSKLGQNIREQIMAFQQKAQSDLGAENTALQNEQQALQKDSAKLPADVRAKKSQALDARQAAFQKKVQEQQSLIQGGEMAARKFYMAQSDAVVHTIMTERGADVVLDKATVVDSGNGLDITKDVMQRLDKKVTSFKVPMVKPSLSDMLQMQGMQGRPQ
jgi:Skp family chaperone for outer membrane proteins